MNLDKKIAMPLWIMVIFLLFVVLYLWKSIFVMLTFTFILLIFFSGLYRYFFKISHSNIISASITGFIFVWFFGIIGFIVSTQIESFTENFDKIGKWFQGLISSNSLLNVYFKDFNIQQIFSNVDFSALWTSALWIISWFAGWLVTVGLLLVFILIEKDTFVKKIDIIFSDKSEKKIENIYGKIYSDLNIFIVSKFLIALLNWVVSWIIMLLFWLEFALLFALFVFILDFIPSVWGAIAMTLPFLFSFVQFDQSYMSFVLLACLMVPQFITGNIIEPRVMGSRLNLSSFVIILSLIFWSSLWWVSGAFLAIPLMVSINIVLSKFSITQPIAIFLSQDGQIKK